MAKFVKTDSMANEAHLAKLKKGVEKWNEWRTTNPHVSPDLRRVNLTGANLDPMWRFRHAKHLYRKSSGQVFEYGASTPLKRTIFADGDTIELT